MLRTGSSLTLSELISPLSAISAALNNCATTRSPQLLALSIQSVAKIFGYHTTTLSGNFNPESRKQVQNLVSSIHSGLAPMTTSSDLEVQERAAELSHLLAFVAADVSTWTFKSDSPIDGVDGGFEETNPPYPKSLFLFQPLHTSHELHALGPKAQESVPKPENLDLDSAIVPNAFDGMQDDIDASEGEEGLVAGPSDKGMEELRRVMQEEEKKRKGKGKKASTVEEKAERERVSRRVCYRQHN